MLRTTTQTRGQNKKCNLDNAFYKALENLNRDDPNSVLRFLAKYYSSHRDLIKQQNIRLDFSSHPISNCNDDILLYAGYSLYGGASEKNKMNMILISSLIEDGYLPSQNNYFYDFFLHLFNIDDEGCLQLLAEILKYLAKHKSQYNNLQKQLSNFSIEIFKKYGSVQRLINLLTITNFINQFDLTKSILDIFFDDLEIPVNRLIINLLITCDDYVPDFLTENAQTRMLLMMLAGYSSPVLIEKFSTALQEHIDTFFANFKFYFTSYYRTCFTNNHLPLAYALSKSSPLNRIFSEEQKEELQFLYDNIVNRHKQKPNSKNVGSRDRLLQKKGLPRWGDTDIQFSDPIEKHAEWVSKHIYQRAYSNGQSRTLHGDMHVNRAVLWATCFIHLSRIFSSNLSLSFDERDIKLIQIALLFHDAARENEGVDYWDRESAELLYYYLTTMLDINESLAALIAEAAANKDYREHQYYYYLILEENNNIRWDRSPKLPVFLHYHDYIHDADCLDIRRCNPNFNGEYLAFYDKIARYDPKAMTALAQLIREATQLIDDMRDGLNTFDAEHKKIFEREHQCYQNIIKILKDNEDYALCNFLLNIDFSNPEHPQNLPLKEIFFTNMIKNENEIVVLRGVGKPSSIVSRKNSAGVTKEELAVALELRKTYRRHSEDSNNTKFGNQNRSTVAWLAGSNVFSCSGFLTSVPKERIVSVSAFNINSGSGKKDDYQPNTTNLDVSLEMEKLATQQQLGGVFKDYPFPNAAKVYLVSHSEIIAGLTEFNAIYFCNSDNPTSYRDNSNHSFFPNHDKTPFVEALFIYQASKNNKT